LKFTGARAAENGDTLILSPFVTERVVLELPQKTVIPGRVDDPFEDVVNQPLLFPGKEIAADDGPGDLPVVGDESPQQAPLFIVIIPVEANCLFLLCGQVFVKGLDSGLRPTRGRRAETSGEILTCGKFSGEEARDTCACGFQVRPECAAWGGGRCLSGT